MKKLLLEVTASCLFETNCDKIRIPRAMMHPPKFGLVWFTRNPISADWQNECQLPSDKP